MTGTDAKWWRSALCAQVDPELWFGGGAGGRSIHPGKAWQAKRLCRVCPVIDPCRAAALDEEDAAGHLFIYGVRGGLGPDQRRKIIQARRRAARQVAA